MADTPDIGKIIGLIMENPELMNQIASLMKKEPQPVSHDNPEEPEAPVGEISAPVGLTPDTEHASAHRRHPERTRLLYAMKPYLRESRGKAIDTMVGILDILDVMGGR